MLRLSERYGDRVPEELPLLFQRILQNAIRDWFRRQKVRNLWVTLFSALSPGKEDDDQDPLETLQAPATQTRRNRRKTGWKERKSLKLLSKRSSACPAVNA